MHETSIIKHTNALLAVAFTPDGRHVAFAGVECTIRIHNVATKKLVRTMKGHTDIIYSLAVTSDGLYLVSASFDKTARVWLVENGTEMRALQHEASVCGVALSPENQLIVTSTGHTGYAVYVWRMADGSLLRQMKGHTDTVWSVAVSPDGLHVVSGSCDRTARVWLLADGALQREIQHPVWVLSVAVTPDSQRIITGCKDAVLRIFLLATGEPVRELRGHTYIVRQVAVSPSGQLVVSGSMDKTVRVWSLFDSRAPLLLTGHTNTVNGVAFHPNGKQVASVSDDGMRLWTVCEWTDRDHQLFGPEFKALVFHLMCIKTRLDNLYKQEEYVWLPRLPMAVWLQIFAFLA